MFDATIVTTQQALVAIGFAFTATSPPVIELQTQTASTGRRPHTGLGFTTTTLFDDMDLLLAAPDLTVLQEITIGIALDTIKPTTVLYGTRVIDCIHIGCTIPITCVTMFGIHCRLTSVTTVIIAFIIAGITIPIIITSSLATGFCLYMHFLLTAIMVTLATMLGRTRNVSAGPTTTVQALGTQLTAATDTLTSLTTIGTYVTLSAAFSAMQQIGRGIGVGTACT
jgi:hypothetical protein